MVFISGARPVAKSISKLGPRGNAGTELRQIVHILNVEAIDPDA